jgi:hypothetical protein
MNRPFGRRGIILMALLLIAALPTAGCQSLMFTALYLIKGTDVDPDFKDLKGKKVVVVCRPMVSLQYANSNVGRELAQQVSLILEAQVPKIKVVDYRKVAQWADENTWDEYPEVGKALKADMVVGIDLESFSLYQGQTLYQGKANATIHVFDCKKGGKQVFHKSIPQAVYPPSAPMPASERTEPDFRAEFENELAGQIARYFFAHDPYADLGKDASSLK